ncbi:glycosyltransferase [Salinicoccus roseus]|uniref:glycosyltransferase n=1 Tax=Salinicoccus roseus TaxID=45670 RepID=UPI0035671527
MKIMHIITTLNSGGAERMLSKLVKKDDMNTHVVVVLLKSKVHYKFEGIRIIHLNKSNNFINKVTILKDLVKVINNEKPEILQTWLKCNYYGPFMKYLFPNIKVVTNFRNGYNGSKNPFKILLLNFFIKEFDGHIFVSKSAFEERANANLLFNNYKIINNGFEIPRTIDRNKKENYLVIGHMGRFHPVKNQANIIKAFNIFSIGKDVKLLLAGKNLIKENFDSPERDNDKVIYLGEISNVKAFYEEIDALVMASKSEGFPNVIGEAMSYGKYVVSTGAGESFDILGNSGYKLQDGEVTSICEAFEYIYSNKDLICKEGSESRSRIYEKYSIESIIQQYQEYYKTLGV